MNFEYLDSSGILSQDVMCGNIVCVRGLRATNRDLNTKGPNGRHPR